MRDYYPNLADELIYFRNRLFKTYGNGPFCVTDAMIIADMEFFPTLERLNRLARFNQVKPLDDRLDHLQKWHVFIGFTD